MTYYEADGVVLLLGDCREVMAQMEPESVSCVVTSPPYWGLRKYECEPSIWGGGPGYSDCPHVLAGQAVEGESYAGRQRWQHDGVSRQETPDAWVKVGVLDKRGLQMGKETSPDARGSERGATCSLCGAWHGQLGLEPTVGAYIEHTMEWVREVWRVLRKDGVFWCDLGDSRGNSADGVETYRLRDDLTSEALAYVLEELKKLGFLGRIG